MVKLNIGCGSKKWDGFINVDYPSNWSGVIPDVACDIRKLPFDNDTADELHAIHVIEHLYLWDAIDALSEWKRVLKPGGMIVLELPSLSKVLYHFQQKPLNPRQTWWALYGDPSYCNPDMVHKWAYTPNMLMGMMQEHGFQNITEEEPIYHYKSRDMRIIGYKEA